MPASRTDEIGTAKSDRAAFVVSISVGTDVCIDLGYGLMCSRHRESPSTFGNVSSAPHIGVWTARTARKWAAMPQPQRVKESCSFLTRCFYIKRAGLFAVLPDTFSFCRKMRGFAPRFAGFRHLARRDSKISAPAAEIHRAQGKARGRRGHPQSREATARS